MLQSSHYGIELFVISGELPLSIDELFTKENNVPLLLRQNNPNPYSGGITLNFKHLGEAWKG